MEDKYSGIEIGSPEETALIEEISAHFPDELQENSRLVKFMAACSLRNRYYDKESSLKRLGKYLQWRKLTFGDCKDQTIEDNKLLREQVRAGLIYLSPTHMPSGAALVFIRMRHHDPKEFDHHATLRYWHYMIMSSLIKYPALAVHGFVFVNNSEGASMANADIQVPRIISSALTKCMPIRVNSVNLVNPPWVFRLIIPVFKTLFPAKLAERINVAQIDDLPALLSVPQEVLPTELGGQVEVDSHDGLLEKMVAENIAV